MCDILICLLLGIIKRYFCDMNKVADERFLSRELKASHYYLFFFFKTILLFHI